MGPLEGIRIVEIGGIGPAPFCGMLLADMGADIIRIARPGGSRPGIHVPEEFNLLHRSRPGLEVDLKSASGVDLVLRLCEKADALFEGFRPGVMEKLGLGPEDCMAVNPRLVYGRVTGWGQDGPLARSAGHDGNYASLVGAIGAIGDKRNTPAVPLNLIADYGGGGTYLAIGLLAALLEARQSGKGQVVDAAMVDGAASLMTLFYGLHAAGLWRDERNSNLLDGGAPFYRAYTTSDGKYVFVAAIEPQFYAELLERTGITSLDASAQYDRCTWSVQEDTLRRVFASATRDEWVERFSNSNACVAPVLSLAEAPHHPHNKARNTFVDIAGIVQPGPAPRFSRTQSSPLAADSTLADLHDVLASRWGLDEAVVSALVD